MVSSTHLKPKASEAIFSGTCPHRAGATLRHRRISLSTLMRHGAHEANRDPGRPRLGGRNRTPRQRRADIDGGGSPTLHSGRDRPCSTEIHPSAGSRLTLFRHDERILVRRRPPASPSCVPRESRRRSPSTGTLRQPASSNSGHREAPSRRTNGPGRRGMRRARVHVCFCSPTGRGTGGRDAGRDSGGCYGIDGLTDIRTQPYGNCKSTGQISC
jgi:hypothetical protein